MGRGRTRRYYWNYTLREGRFVVKHGIPDDPERRLEEMENEGLRFTSMIIDPTAVSEKTAREREEERIETYQRSHRSRKPRYNK